MATVNSRFMTVGSNEPDIQLGWQIRVLDYKDMTSPVTILNEYTTFSFTQELNGTGTGSVTLDEDSPIFGVLLNNQNSHRILLNHEYVFEAWDHGVPRFAWLAQTVANTVIGEDETRAITISGPGIAQALRWGIIQRPGWPKKAPVLKMATTPASPTTKIAIYRETSYNDKLPAFQWQFPVGWPTMRMWYTVFKAAQRRGVIPMVKPMFGPLKDSGKQPWLAVKTLTEVETKEGYQPDSQKTDLLDFLNSCTGQDYTKWFGQRLEWLMYPGFKLDVRRHIGADRSAYIRFFHGQILSVNRTRDRETIYNRVTTVDVYANEIIRTDKNSIAKWNMRENRNDDNKNVTNTKLLVQIADRTIQQNNDEKDEWTVKIPYDDFGRIPYRNFFVGDTIGLSADFAAATSILIPDSRTIDKYRIMAITVSVSSDSSVPECELTLKSIIDSKMDELEKKITELINNPVVVNLADVADVSVSNPSDGDTLVYNADTGKWESGTATTANSLGIWVQSQDPATVTGATVNPGDFWLETYD